MFRSKTKIKHGISLGLIGAMLMPIFTPVSQAFFDFGSGDFSSPGIERTKLISLLVDEELLADSDLDTKITRYGMDISQKLAAQVVQIPIPHGASPRDIWEGNAHLYFSGLDSDQKSQLIGTVLIGDVPLPVVDKGGNFLPTVFPYTDFVDPAYYWNEEENRFFRGAGDLVPEIWHGVIRSSVTDSFESRKKELLDYFDRNHSFHTGGETFSKRIFFADLPLQKNGLPDTLLKKYDDFIEHVEDLAYLRFNKHLLTKLLDDQDFDDVIPWDDIADEAKPTELSTMSDNVKYMPDIQTKLVIDNFVQRYVEIYKNHLAQWNKKIKNSGRWSPDEVDTTISLVTRKDELSALTLRGANDALEEVLIAKAREVNVDENLEFPTTETLSLVEMELNEVISETPVTKPLYWNGVLRTTLTADDCSLYRGILKDADHPFAVLAEANRTFYLQTADSCAHKDEPSSTKNADQYEGCCAKNISVGADSMEIGSNGGCNTGSEWLPKEAENDLDFIHYGAELPVFDYAGGVEITAGQSGAIGCALIFGDASVEGPSSLMVHQEPTIATINAQMSAYGTRSLPVDDPRGISFYDHGNVFRRVQFTNLFDYREEFTEAQSTELKTEIQNALIAKIQEINAITTAGNAISNAALVVAQGTSWPGVAGEGDCDYGKSQTQLDQYTIKIEWTETCEVAQEPDPEAPPGTPDPDPLEFVSTIVRFYETGGLIPENLFDEILAKIDLDKIAESLFWIDKTIDEKNQIVFEKAFSDPETFQDFFHDEGFDGYEFAEVLATPLDDESIEMNFEWGTVGFYDEEYDEALREANGFVFTKSSGEKKEFLEVDTEEYTVGENFFFKNEQGQIKAVPATKASSSSVTEIRVEPAEIAISGSQVDPIKINVSLRDKDGEIVETDFQSEVELVFPETAKDFFRIVPFQKTTAYHGEASFLLIPKTTEKSQKLTFHAETDALQSEEIQVEILNFELSPTADKFSVPVKDTDGVFLKARVFDFDDNISYGLDGEQITFATEWGTFQGGQNTTKIEKGVAGILFFPGKEAGLAEIMIRDEKGKLPPKKLFITIEPGPPVAIDLGSDRALVKGAEFSQVAAQIVDEFGNIIDDIETKFQWETENLEISDSDEETFETQSEAGKSAISVRDNSKETTARIEVFADVLPEGTGRSINFNVVKDPVLRAEIEPNQVVAGQDTPVKMKIFAEDGAGKKIRGDFEIFISEESTLFRNKLNTIIVQDGEGEFDFIPGTKSGNFEIAITSHGFVPTTVDFNLLPEKPEKIEISMRKEIIEMDSNKSFFVDVRVVDKFGNTADFDDQIWIYPTDKTSNRIKRDSTHVFVHDGIGEMKIWPQSSGIVHLIAKFDSKESSDSTVTSLILDALEFEIKNKFSFIDAADLTSKSIFSMWLDFPGMDFLRPKAFANRVFHGGENLALGTHISDPTPNLRFGFLAPDGKIDKKLKPELNFGEVLEFDIFAQEQNLVRTQILFNEPLFFINAEKRKKDGLYLDFGTKINSKITEENGIILMDKNSLFSIQERGGISLIDSKIKFVQSSHDSIFVWGIFLDEEKIGDLEIVFADADLRLVTEFPPTDVGIFLKKIAPDIEVKDVFTDNSTHGLRGLAFVSTYKKESSLKKLGQEPNSQRKIWEGDWKPGILFAAQNSAGESAMFGADDNFILLGDPTASVLTANTKSAFGFTTDVGRPIWSHPKGMKIDQVLTGDANGDGNTDIFVRERNFVFALLADDTGVQNFRDGGPLLRFADGGEVLLSLDNDEDGFTDFIQLNDDAKIIFHKNQNGNFVREELNFPEIERPIVNLKKGDFNGDEVSDLVVLDDGNGLWYVLGDKDSFQTPKKIYDFFPNFEESVEEYSVAVSRQADFDRTVQKNSGPFLNKLLVTFDELNSEDQISEFFDKKPFVAVSDNSSFDATLKTSNDAKTIVEPSDLILAEFEIDSDSALSNFEFIVPEFKNMEVVTDSLLCNGCASQPVFKKINDRFVVQNIPVPANEKIKFSWKLRVAKMLPIDFFVGDFDHRDDIDDLSVPREIAGEKNFIQFLSNPVQTTSFVPKTWLAAISSSISSLVPLEKRVIPVSEFGVNTEPSDTIDVPVVVQTKLSETNTVTGLPQGWNGAMSQNLDYTASTSSSATQMSSALNEVRGYRNDFVCGDGNCGISTLSKAFRGPGYDVTYLSPFAYFSGMNVGKPVFAFPTTKFTSHGPVISMYPLDSPGKQFPSVFTSFIRSYVSPTTTGKVGLSVCLGNYVSNMIAPIFSQKCFVSVPSTLPDFGITEELGLADFTSDVNRKAFSATNFQTGGSGSVFQISSTTANKNATPKSNNFKLSDSIPDISNTQIKPVSPIETWVTEQYQEIGNFKLPSVTIKKLNLPENFDSTESVRESAPEMSVAKEEKSIWKNLFTSVIQDEKGTGSSQNGFDFGKEIGKLNQNSLIEIRKEKITIPIPKITSEMLGNIGGKLENLKGEIGNFSEKLKTEMEDFKPNIDFDPEVIKSALTQSIKDLKDSFAQIEIMIESLISFQEKTKNIDFEKSETDLLAMKSRLQDIKADAQNALDNAPNETVAANAQKVLNWANGLESQIDANLVVIDSYKTFAGTDLNAQLTKTKKQINSLETDIGEIVINFDKNALNGQIKALLTDALSQIEKIPEELGKQIETLKAIPEKIAELEKVPEKLEKMIGELGMNQEFFKEYLSMLREGLLADMEKWLSMRETLIQLMNAWEVIPQIFVGFTNGCPTPGCSADRGTLIELLLKILLGSISLPVIQMPQLPDVVLDLSNISFGMKIAIPELELKPVELDISGMIPDLSLPNPSLPNLDLDIAALVAGMIPGIPSVGVGVGLPEMDLPDFGMLGDLAINFDFQKEITLPEINIPSLSAIPNLDLNLPDMDFNLSGVIDVNAMILAQVGASFSIPEIPKFPSLPNIDLDFSAPMPSMPPVPHLPAPPEIPNILDPLLAIIEIPKKIMKLLCLLVMGVAPVPEWSVNAYVAQLTNRQMLLDLDFTPGALFPSTPKAALEPIVIAPTFAMGTEITALTDSLAMIADSFSSMITKFGAQNRLPEPIENPKIPIKGGEEIVQKPEIITTVYTFDESDFSNVKADEKVVAQIQKLKEFPEKLENESLPQKFVSNLKSFLPSAPKYLTDIQNSDFKKWNASAADFILSDQKAAMVGETYSEPAPGIYFMDPETEIEGFLIDYKPEIESAIEFANFDIKTAGEQKFTNAESESVLISIDDLLFLKNKVEPDLQDEQEKFGKIIELSFEEFKEKFAPFVNMKTRTSISGAEFSFEPFSDVPYVEWFVTDRFDHLSEESQAAKSRVSQKWERRGQLLRDTGSDSKIRPISVRVNKIFGAPIFYSVPLEEVPSCDDKMELYWGKNIFNTQTQASRFKIERREGDKINEEIITINVGEEFVVENAKVCTLSGVGAKIEDGNSQKFDAKRDFVFSSKFRIETGKNDLVELELFDGSILSIGGGENLSLEVTDKDNKTRQSILLPTNNFYGSAFAIKKNKKSYVVPTSLYDPQLADDIKSPTIRVRGGVAITVPVFQKLVIDASESFDDHEISKVFWDLNAEIDSDGDGNSENDFDFPLADSEHSATELLKISIPPRKQKGVSEIVINTEDPSGNVSSQKITITAIAPEIKLFSASVRDAKIEGTLKNKFANVPIYFSRKRNYRSEFIRETPIFTDEKGKFEMTDIISDGGIEITEMGKVVAEILPTGRPIIFDDRFNFQVLPATEASPFGIRIHDEKNLAVGYVFFETQESPVSIQDSTKELSDLSGANVWDTNLEDNFEFKVFPENFDLHKNSVAVFDKEKPETLGILDGFGNFYISEDDNPESNPVISFRIKRAINDTDPVVFEILVDGTVIGEFFVSLVPAVFIQ